MTQSARQMAGLDETIACLPTPPPRTPPSAKVDAQPCESEVSAEDTLEMGLVVDGRYRIEAILGRGGMATVYLAHHVEIGACVAIKVLRRKMTSVPEIAQRFLAEARAVSKVHNPHVVRVSDYGELDDDRPWMAMEYLQGEDLDAYLRAHGPLPWRRARSILLQVCEALEAVHEAGIVHCDVKPQNCLRQAEDSLEDFIKLLDFGIARMPEQGEGWGADCVVGTPEYMAPEQIRGRAVDRRTDVYALGVMTFVLLTGRPPFEADDADAVLEAHLRQDPPRPSEVRPGLPPGIDAIVLRAMAKNPNKRFPTARAMAAALRAVRDGSTRRHGEERRSMPVGPEPPTLLLGRFAGRRWLLALAVGCLLALIVPVQSIGASTPVPVRVGLTAALEREPSADLPDLDPAEPFEPVAWLELRSRSPDEPAHRAPAAESRERPTSVPTRTRSKPAAPSTRTNRPRPPIPATPRPGRATKRDAPGSMTIDPLKNPFD